MSCLTNSLWPCDTIWHQRSWATSAQVMACCLMATSHFWNQYWQSSVRYCGIHLRTVSQEMLKMSMLDMSLKMPILRLQLHHPVANMLICSWWELGITDALLFICICCSYGWEHIPKPPPSFLTLVRASLIGWNRTPAVWERKFSRDSLHLDSYPSCLKCSLSTRLSPSKLTQLR